MIKSDDRLSLAQVEWPGLLRTALDTPSLRNTRELFLEINPHLKGQDQFLDRYKARKIAAVMIPVVLRAEPTVLLTVRSPDMPSHAGQVSFPGGKVHDDDPSLEFTARRETQEEVGISAEYIDVIGDVGIHVGGMGFSVTPFLGLVDPKANFVACPREVDEIFEVPLSFIIDMNNHTTIQKSHNGVEYNMFSLPYGNYHIWGLTAGILNSLAERVNAVL